MTSNSPSSMIKSILPAVFAAFILLTGTIAGSIVFIPMGDAAAMQSKGHVTGQYGSATKNKVCGDRLCSEPKAEEKMKEQPKAEEKMKEQPKAPVATMEPQPQWKTTSGTMTSKQDPGVGHESHQLIVLLSPSDKVYEGILTYSASEPIQLVSLHGPIAKGDDSGQPTWTPDGMTKYGWVLIDNNDSAGTWHFAGNALAVHTKNKDPFSVSFSLHYMEAPMSDTVQTGTLHSEKDPGLGHEKQQLAIVLAPRDTPYSGTISFTASEPVQLVALHGPLKEGQDLGQPIWTQDGKTKFALTSVDKGEKTGVWSFAGNALAFHTMNETPFTVTYSVEAE